MQFAVITVGTELTLGFSIDTNSAYIARTLGMDGHSCSYMVSVSDDVDDIAGIINKCLDDVDGVILTGGLGPTLDDLTREALCQAFGLKLEYQPGLAKSLEERFSNRHSPMPEIAFRQAYLPTSAKAIEARVGSAPGIILRHDDRFAIALPGVPAEMMDMMQDVRAWLHAEYPPNNVYATRIIKTVVPAESLLQQRIEDIEERLTSVSIGIIAAPYEVQLQLVGNGATREIAVEAVHDAELQLIERLGDDIYGYDDDSLPVVVGRQLKSNNITCAVAESCTGGLVSKLITDIPGSSEYFIGGAITYSNNVKNSILSVPTAVLEEFGAVSAETAEAMARGVRELMGAAIGCSITGIAGPGGGSAEKPIGLVHFGLSDSNGEISERYMFHGNREIIRIKSATVMLDILRRYLLNKYALKGSDTR